MNRAARDVNCNVLNGGVLSNCNARANRRRPVAVRHNVSGIGSRFYGAARHVQFARADFDAAFSTFNFAAVDDERTVLRVIDCCALFADNLAAVNGYCRAVAVAVAAHTCAFVADDTTGIEREACSRRSVGICLAFAGRNKNTPILFRFNRAVFSGRCVVDCQIAVKPNLYDFCT